MKSCFDQQKKKLNELMEMTRGTDQRVAGLDQDFWQPRLAMEEDMQADNKTYERTEGAAKQCKRCMGIPALRTGSIPIRCARPVSA